VQSRNLIAIIDDDALVRDSVQRLIRSMGFEAEQFSSPDDFLGSASLDATWCIVSDVNMANAGAEFLQDRLKVLGYDIPIVFMTGRPNRATLAKLMEAGALSVLRKPFNQQEITRCFAQARARRHFAGESSALAALNGAH